MFNILADSQPTTWPDVAFMAVIGATIVGFYWAINRND